MNSNEHTYLTREVFEDTLNSCYSNICHGLNNATGLQTTALFVIAEALNNIAVAINLLNKE